MNEFELIAQLTQALPSNDAVVLGAGDDCAVLDLGLPGALILFKTDAVVEGVHFGPEATPEQIGHKALARCLSDIAAMGGSATAALVTLGLPKTFDSDRVKRIYSGLADLARRHRVAIVGGETTTNPGGLLLSSPSSARSPASAAPIVPAPKTATPSSSPANWAVPSAAATSPSSRASPRPNGSSAIFPFMP